MMSDVDIVFSVKLPEVLSPVARGGGRRGRIGQTLVKDMSIRVIIDLELHIVFHYMVASKISIDFPGCIHVNLGSNQTPSL